MQKYGNHPLAYFFPYMREDQFESLKKDIEKHGLLEPIVLCHGDNGSKQILDGRHRYRALEELGMEGRFRDLPEGIEPKDYVIATNMKRRHLDPAQKVAVLVRADMAIPGKGKGQEIEYVDSYSPAEVAHVAMVSEDYVRKALVAAQDEELLEKMASVNEKEHMTVNDAYWTYRARHDPLRPKHDPYKDAPGVSELLRELNHMKRQPKGWLANLEQGKLDVAGHAPLIITKIEEVVDELRAYKSALNERLAKERR